jgi:hypothetical protein
MSKYRLFGALGFVWFIIGAIGIVISLVALAFAFLSPNVLPNLITASVALIASLVLLAFGQGVQIVMELLAQTRAHTETLARIEIKINNLAAAVDAVAKVQHTHPAP